jgi:hypothetical protein
MLTREMESAKYGWLDCKAALVEPGPGKNFSAAVRCSAALSCEFGIRYFHFHKQYSSTLNAMMPTMIPSPKKMNAIINQITPQTVVGQGYSLSGVRMCSPRDGQQGQISANALASEVLTLRRMVSSSNHENETFVNARENTHR